MISFSIVIVTKNRSQVLKQCLGSLASQTTPPKELIIIDNSSIDSTPKVIKNFQNNVSFPVKLFVEKKGLYPEIYNRGLKESKSDWVAFIDDDCVADPEWVESIQKGIKTHPKAAVLMGNSKTFYDKNVFSIATWMLDELWKTDGRKGEVVHDFTTLDNRNIVYNQDFLKKNSLEYDDQRTAYNGAAEDSDFGLQIKAAGGTANYLLEMIIFHKDPQSWGHFWKKIIVSQKAFNTLRPKWGSKLDFSADQILSFHQKFNLHSRSLFLSLTKKIVVLLLMFSAGFITNNFLKHENL